MGKSETARMFREEGVPVFDADDAVHQLYQKGGRAVPLVGKRFPQAIVDQSIDRERLSSLVLGDGEALKDLERIVHPLVQGVRQEFLENARQSGELLAVLDIPLLFETGGEGQCDRIVVVSAPYEIQRERALERPGMTDEKLAAILAKQVPDEQKRARADFIVDSSKGLAAAQAQVRDIVRTLTADK